MISKMGNETDRDVSTKDVTEKCIDDHIYSKEETKECIDIETRLKHAKILRERFQ